MVAKYKKLWPWPPSCDPSVGPIDGAICRFWWTPQKVIFFTGQLWAWQYILRVFSNPKTTLFWCPNSGKLTGWNDPRWISLIFWIYAFCWHLMWATYNCAINGLCITFTKRRKLTVREKYSTFFNKFNSGMMRMRIFSN